jgi:hypothetical protein
MKIDFTDYNSADQIPAGTNCILQINIRFGDARENTLSFTRGRDAETLKVRFKIVDGQYANREFWQDFMVVGTDEGQKTMALKNNAILKRILDSAKNLDPTDESPAAREARSIEYRDFDGLRFQGVIGVQPARTDKTTGQTYDARNVLEKVITRDMPSWRGPIEQGAPFNDNPPFDQGSTSAANGQAPTGPAPTATTTPAPISKPNWAS